MRKKSKIADKATKSLVAKPELVTPVVVPEKQKDWYESNCQQIAQDIRTMTKSWRNKTAYKKLMEQADKIAERTAIDLGEPSHKLDTYNPEVGVRIASLMACGATSFDIERITGISRWVCIRWRIEVPEFKRMLDRAKLESASQLVDEALDAVRSASNGFDLKKSDALQKIATWIAQRRDVEGYGNVERKDVRMANVILDYRYGDDAPATTP